MIIVDEDDKRFYIAPSTVPGAGNGLFAKEMIRKGDCLEVIGVMVRAGSEADQCTEYANHYKFAASDKNPTCYIVPLGYAGIVNHTDDKSQQNVFLSYSKSRSKRNPNAGQVAYEALRDIVPGEEILGYYGDGRDKALKWQKNKSEWDKFLAHNLYDLGTVPENLRKSGLSNQPPDPSPIRLSMG
jgi:SET domain-containing protein